LATLFGSTDTHFAPLLIEPRLVSLFIVSARFHRNPALDAVAPVLFDSPPSSLYIRFFSYRPIHSPPGNPTFYLPPSLLLRPQRNADPQLANSFLNDMERITERRYIPTDGKFLFSAARTIRAHGLRL
jgi:hypothetical protein